MFLSWSEDHFFCYFNLGIFLAFLLSKLMDTGYLVCATPPTVLCRFFWNFTDVFVMIWRYACGLDIILRLFFVLILLPCEFCIMLIMHDEYMPTKLQLQFWHHLLYFKITRCWANWTAIDKMGWYTPDSTLQSTYTLVRQILSKSNITNVTLLILSIGNRSLCGVVVKLIAL